MTTLQNDRIKGRQDDRTKTDDQIDNGTLRRRLTTWYIYTLFICNSEAGNPGEITDLAYFQIDTKKRHCGGGVLHIRESTRGVFCQMGN